MIKQRNIGLYILFTIITCGIFGLYWMYTLNEDVNSLNQSSEATSSGMVILFTIITCGIYSIYWSYKISQGINEAKSRNGMAVDGNITVVCLLLSLFGLIIITWALLQREINQYTQELPNGQKD